MRRIGVDVGGTFTDVVLADEAGDLHVLKLESTPEDPSRAMITGIARILAEAGSGNAVGQVLHGTTIATNMILEHEGCTVGMLTTEGFRDLLHIARHKRPFNFSLYQSLPWQSMPVVQRRHRLPVPERIGARGEIVLPLDEAAVRSQARRLKQAGVQAVAICFLFSFVNPEHEDLAAQIVREEFPEAFLSVSGHVVPQYREFERFATACLNAYIGPDVRRYLEHLVAGVPDVTAGIHIMTSSGGVTTVTDAIERPVQLVLSGPVAGVVGGMWSGGQAGEDNVITLDVGGTSADIGLVEGGTLRMRPLADSGVGAYQALIPMVDVSTIGAGGGSVAFVDEGGMYRVGPRSAGARPGPAAYGLGGTEATITDAMVNVGWFGEDIQLSGRTRLSPELAYAAFEPVADRLGLTVIEASAGAIEIMTSAMVGAIEESSTRKGYDPRDFALVAGGGAGPSLAPLIAREVGMPRVIVPTLPGLMSTVGLLATDVAYEVGRTIHATVSADSLADLAAGYRGLEATGTEMLRRAGIAEADMVLQRLADCRYAGQGYELRVACPAGPIDESWLAAVTVNFEKVHTREYSMHYDDRDIEIPTVHLRAIGRMPKLRARPAPPSRGGTDAVRTAPAWFMTESGPREFDTRRCQRADVAAGKTYAGPMVVAQYDATLVVPPGFTVEVGAAGTLVVIATAAGTAGAAPGGVPADEH